MFFIGCLAIACVVGIVIGGCVTLYALVKRGIISWDDR